MTARRGWGADYDDPAGYEKRLEGYNKMLSQNLTGFWPQLRNLFIRWMTRQFASQGAYWNGFPWVPLTPAYAAWKALHYPGKGILVAEGDLKRGATMPGQRQTPKTVTFIIEWPKKPNRWTSHFNPDWHHSGMGNNPARPLLQEEFLQPAMRLELDHEADEYARVLAEQFGL